MIEIQFGLIRGSYRVETKDFVTCEDERVKIPPAAWSDVANLIGKVYIVKNEDKVPEREKEVSTGVELAGNPEAAQSLDLRLAETDVEVGLDGDARYPGAPDFGEGGRR